MKAAKQKPDKGTARKATSKDTGTPAKNQSSKKQTPSKFKAGGEARGDAKFQMQDQSAKKNKRYLTAKKDSMTVDYSVAMKVTDDVFDVFAGFNQVCDDAFEDFDQ